MDKLTLPLSLAAAATLAACVTYEPVTPAPAPVVIQSPPAVVAAPPATVVVPPVTTAPVVVVAAPALRAGFGRIDSIAPAPEASAAAGGTAPGPMQRIGLRMDDGVVQYVDTRAQFLSVGDRVEITRDGYIRHPV